MQDISGMGSACLASEGGFFKAEVRSSRRSIRQGSCIYKDSPVSEIQCPSFLKPLVPKSIKFSPL